MIDSDYTQEGTMLTVANVRRTFQGIELNHRATMVISRSGIMGNSLTQLP